MPSIPYFEVLAFTNRMFGGNPAGICLLEDDWLPDELMQQIARENNLAETAFVIERANHFDLRWFTPAIEVDLCGHATLASAHVIFSRKFGVPPNSHAGRPRPAQKRRLAGDQPAESTETVDLPATRSPSLEFHSRAGELKVSRQNDLLELDFPSRPATAAEDSIDFVGQALRAKPERVLRERDYYAIFAREADVAALAPDLAAVAALDLQGVVVTAPGDKCDFVSRYFAPAAGIPEDPVTGSTHCTLIPYWSERLANKKLKARQISARVGELFCEDRGARVGIGGNAVTYLEGTIHLP